MKIDIILEGGHWTVNGKKSKDLNQIEKQFMNGFFKWAKQEKLTLKTISNEND